MEYQDDWQAGTTMVVPADIRSRIRLRTIQTLCRLSIFALLSICFVAVFTSPRFNIRSVRIVGADRVPTEEVLKSASYLIGKNFLRAPLKPLRKRLERMHQVQQVKLVRWPIASLTIYLVERRPSFSIDCKEGSCLADANGLLFDNSKGHEDPHVWIEGYRPSIGDRMDHERLDAVMHLVNGAHGTGVIPMRIFIDRTGFASMKIHGGTLVRLGDDDWDRKLRWLPRALQMIRDKNTIAGYIDITTLKAPVWKPLGSSAT